MLVPLIQNETLKILRRRRFMVVVGILFVILSLVSYSQTEKLKRTRNQNWRAEIQERIARYENYIRRTRSSNEAWVRTMRIDIQRLQFYLDHDINPDQPTAPLVVRIFANAAGWLLPLLVAVIGSDIVSAEASEGTNKLLLTRPVRRWKILTAKLITLFIFATLTLIVGAVIAYVVTAPFIPPRGWAAPMFNGFQLTSEKLSVDNIRELPLWKDAMIAYGLEWYALLAVAAISLLTSVIFKSSAAAIGTMLASLIGGTALTRMSPDWTAGKYLFVSAVPLSDYYSGLAPPYEGMTMTFCIALLAIWSAGALIGAYALFLRRDVFG